MVMWGSVEAWVVGGLVCRLAAHLVAVLDAARAPRRTDVAVEVLEEAVHVLVKVDAEVGLQSHKIEGVDTFSVALLYSPLLGSRWLRCTCLARARTGRTVRSSACGEANESELTATCEMFTGGGFCFCFFQLAQPAGRPSR